MRNCTNARLISADLAISKHYRFLYDFTLLINSVKSKYHPELLIHGNIFDVDQGTLIESINYIGENTSLHYRKQYILTINSDKFSDSD